MLTPFGRFIRDLRIQHCELLRDMAKNLNVGPAFLSGVENGYNDIPKEWTIKITKMYSLSNEQVQSMNAAVIAHTKVKINTKEDFK